MEKMSRLDRYIAGEIFRFFAMILLLVAVVFLVVDYLSNADKFFAVGLPMKRALAYVLFRLPRELVQLLPLCLLLSILTALGMVNRSNELTALKGGGIGPGVLLRPVMLVAACVCLLGLFVVEMIAPSAAARVNTIRYEELYPSAVSANRRENIRIRQDTFFIHIREVDVENERMEGVHLLETGRDTFLPRRRILAQSGIFVPEGWMLEAVVIQDLDEKTGAFTSRFHPQWMLKVGLQASDFERTRRGAEEMGIRALWRYIGKIQGEGYDTSRYRVDLFGKTAFPFAAFVLSMLAVSIALRPSMKKNMAVGMGYGMGVAFLYWICYSFSLSLGYGGILPPVFAAWMPNLFFGALGVYGLLGVE
jgi:lipopolysaccharide export system permease protein